MYSADEMDPELLELSKPLPLGVRLGEFGSWLPYEKFPAFSWSWAWRRAVIFALVLFPFGALFGLVHGLFAQSVAEGMIVAASTFGVAIVTVGAGPFAAAAIRQSKITTSTERVLIVLAVAAGSLLSVFARRYAEDIHDQLMGTSPTSLERLVVLVHGGYSSHVTVSIASSLLAWLGFGAVLNGALAVRSYLGEQERWREFHRQEQMAAHKIARLEAERDLGLLQAQVEPHFLFNTLASVRSLAVQDPHNAVRLIDAMCSYLRSTLPKLREGAGARSSTLGAQVDICRHYLALMELRLAGRLTVDVVSPPDLCELPFPPLLLISLVENAVTHGVEPKPGPARIEVRATMDEWGQEQALVVEVLDNGPGLGDELGDGTGLTNVRSQLAALYADDAQLLITSRSGGGVRAAILIARRRLA
jgi:hypothetical protein